MNWSEFRRAVKDSEEPTPGYLYNTLAQWTYADHATQQQLVNALFDKLRPPLTGPPSSVHVLYKSLHLIRVLCESGHPDFQRQVQSTERSNVLRNYATYHGSQDPMHGDALNEKVRREAKTALEAAFNDRGSGQGDFTGGGSAGPVGESSHRGSSFGFLHGEGTGGGGGGAAPDAAFRTGESYASGGSPSSMANAPFQPVGRIGEMPQENRWMAYVANVEAHRTTQPSNTLLEQLSKKAKAGWDLIREHEGMKLKDDRIYDTASKRRGLVETAGSSAGVGSSGAGGIPSRAALLFDPTDTHASSYQPVGVPIAPPDELDDIAAAIGEDASAPEPSPSHGTSRFAFVNGLSPSHQSAAPFTNADATAAEERGDDNALLPSQQQQQHAHLPFHRVVHRLAAAKSTPQRVELAEFVSACLSEGEKRLASAATSEASSPFLAQARQQAVFAFLDGADDGTTGMHAVTPEARLNALPRASLSTTAAADVWRMLAAAMDEQLAPQQPWQHRLNTLCGLEALLVRCDASSSGGCGQALQAYFTAKPENVARNAHVAQSSLCERAARVASLLNISTNLEPDMKTAPPLADPAPLAPASTAETSDTGLRLDGLSVGGARRRAPPPQQTAAMKDIFGATTAPTDPPASSLTPEPVHASLFATEDGGSMRLRRRAPMGSTRGRPAEVTTATPSSTGTEKAPTVLDDLFGGEPAPQAPQLPAATTASTRAPSGPQPDPFDDLFTSAHAPSQPQLHDRRKQSITVLGVRSNTAPTAGVAEPSISIDPFADTTPSTLPQQQVYYNSYGSGHPVPVAEGSSHFTTSHVTSSGPAPGSVQSMNKAFAEMQRKLMSEQPESQV